MNYISDSVVKRLPGYYRHLHHLETRGVTSISSQELGDIMGLTASQIRQDINRIGATGRQGCGYNVIELKNHIGMVLNITEHHSMVILGAGNIGRAVAQSDSFLTEGFETLAIFDIDEAKIGKEIAGMPVRHLKEIDSFIQENHVDIAVVAVPAQYAQEVTDQLLELGICGFWNFAPIDLKLPRHAASVNVHLTDGLEVLSYHLKHMDD